MCHMNDNFNDSRRVEEQKKHCSKLWKLHSEKVTKTTDKIVNFIILDDQLVSCWKCGTFCHLIEHLELYYCFSGCKCISETAPRLYKTVREHISRRLKDVQAISFATHIWNTNLCHVSWLQSGWTVSLTTFNPQIYSCKKMTFVGHILAH